MAPKKDLSTLSDEALADMNENLSNERGRIREEQHAIQAEMSGRGDARRLAELEAEKLQLQAQADVIIEVE